MAHTLTFDNCNILSYGVASNIDLKVFCIAIPHVISVANTKLFFRTEEHFENGANLHLSRRAFVIDGTILHVICAFRVVGVISEIGACMAIATFYYQINYFA